MFSGWEFFNYKKYFSTAMMFIADAEYKFVAVVCDVVVLNGWEIEKKLMGAARWKENKRRSYIASFFIRIRHFWSETVPNDPISRYYKQKISLL